MALSIHHHYHHHHHLLSLINSKPGPPPSTRRLTQYHRTCAALRNSSSAAETDDFTKYSGYLFDQSDVENDYDSVFDYDIYRIKAFYQKRPLLLLRRLYQTATTLGKWFLLTYIDRVTGRTESMFQVRAAELRKILVQLGPAYIKIAQAVSSRPDLIPPSYLDELSLLQDQIAPFPSAVAFSRIEQNLRAPVEEIFSKISPVPVAAASLGQVYQARLRDTGKVVAVKVQRPGVHAAVSLDILILRLFAGLTKKIGKFNTDLQAVVDEWASSLFREMDYTIEANNGLKFRQLYGGLKDVVVPQMIMEKTTCRVLVLEWVEGEKLSEVKDLHIVEVGVYCSFNQLLECGFYHADPHPGNLLRTFDGKLAYLDFGMMGEFEQERREGFIEACLHLINRDFDALSRDFVTLGLLPPTTEKEAVMKALTGVFEGAVSKGVANISFGDLLGDLGKTMYKFKFRIPSYFSLVIRSLAVLEGIAISFNPSYKVLGNTYPWIARKVLTDSSPQLQSSLKGLLYRDGVFRIDRLESLLSESLRANTETRSVKGALDDSGTDTITKQVLSFVLSEKGGFLKEILLDEIAKGLDALSLATLDSLNLAASRSFPFVDSMPVSLMNDHDVTSMRTLYRLLLLLSKFQRNEQSVEVNHLDGGINSNEMARIFYLHALSGEMLPILSVVPELSPDEQLRLLYLPSDLARKLISRVAARTLQRLFLF